MPTRPSQEARDFHGRIPWASWRKPREIERLGDRAFEVLQGLRAGGVDDFVPCQIISEIIRIESGPKYASRAHTIRAALQNYSGAVERKWDDKALLFRAMSTEAVIKPDAKVNAETDPALIAICDRFHRAVSHVTKRRKGKKPIDFSDEYDLQDVFGVILKCLYESVKDEEWTPSYAGSAARIDFLIEDIATAAELKLARPNHKVGDELVVDIGRYRSRPDIRTLVCFVYDPEGHLGRDASELEKTLSGRHAQDASSIAVRVLIRPH
jgi:hypothetical protein